MSLTAVEAIAHPDAAWWSSLWPTAWAVTAAALAAWFILRAGEKRHARPDADEDGSDPDAEASPRHPARPAGDRIDGSVP